MDVVYDSAVGGKHDFVGNGVGFWHGDVNDCAAMEEGCVTSRFHTPEAGVTLMKDHIFMGESCFGLGRRRGVI